MDAGGRGMQALVWGGPVPDTRTGRMLGGLGAGGWAGGAGGGGGGHAQRRREGGERMGQAGGAGEGVMMRRRWSGDTLTQEPEQRRRGGGGGDGHGVEGGGGGGEMGEERSRLSRAMSDGAALVGVNERARAGESKLKSSLRRFSFLRRRKNSTVEQGMCVR